jgi:poly-gamma-glutamate capsule biosynthesis protein CapA/YwtB (metallophosphatase superfamily)
MRARRLALGAAASVAAVAIAACTSGGDSASPGSPGQSGQTGATGDPTGSPTSTDPPATAEPFVPRQITVVMSGDVLLHSGLWETAEIDAQRTGRGVMDFRPLLADMRQVISGADLAICHMETPLAPKGGPYESYPIFAAPPAIVPALKWAGYDACTTASNHSVDQGWDGIVRTLDDFRRHGIETAGTAATKADSKQALMMDVNGVEVALISATYGTNGLPIPAEEPWSVPLIKPAKIERMAARAKDDGADIVMVGLHWGLEYYHPPTQDQIDVAEQLTSSPDIDFVYGEHAHVVQPYDRMHGTWVVYGLGNQVAQQDTAVEGVYDGNTCRVTFKERRDGTFKVAKLEYIPTMITHFDGVHPMRLINVPASLDDPEYASLRPALLATEQRVTDVIGSLGAFKKGVVEGE